MSDKVEEMAERLMVALVSSPLYGALHTLPVGHAPQVLAGTAFTLAEAFEKRRQEYRNMTAATPKVKP